MMIFRGVGLLVTFGTVILGTAGGVGWYVWLIIPIYWGAGKVLLDALMRLSLDPKLDAKYPLSVPSRDEDS